MKGAEAEIQRLGKELENGVFYLNLAAKCGIPLSEVKRDFLSGLNSRVDQAIWHRAYREFSQSYPVLHRMISRIKSKDHTNMSLMMACILSQAIDETLKFCMDNKLPAFPRTDEIVCRDEDADIVRVVLAKAFYRVTSVRPKIGGVRVDLDKNEKITPLNSETELAHPFSPLVNNKNSDGITHNDSFARFAA
jgi:hypothetical protein